MSTEKLDGCSDDFLLYVCVTRKTEATRMISGFGTFINTVIAGNFWGDPLPYTVTLWDKFSFPLLWPTTKMFQQENFPIYENIIIKLGPNFRGCMGDLQRFNNLISRMEFLETALPTISIWLCHLRTRWEAAKEATIDNTQHRTSRRNNTSVA